MQELTNYLIRGRARDGAVMVGRQFAAPVGPEGTKVVGQVLGPDKTAGQLTLRSQVTANVTELAVADTDQIGAYRVSLEEPSREEFSFGVNANPAESDLAAVNENELHDNYPGFEFNYMTSYQPNQMVFANGTRSASSDWTTGLLYIALGLAFCELLLLMWSSWMHATGTGTASSNRTLLGRWFAK
jgi:hypothetical protein